MNDATSSTAATPAAPKHGLLGGALLMVLFKVMDRAIGFVSVMILARLLTPADYGLVAMAMSVLALIELMSAFGFDAALIQRHAAERSHFDTAWTFYVLFGAATALLLLVLAQPAALFYKDERVASIMCVLALTAFLGGFGNVGVVMFRKELDFKREFRFMLSKRLAGFAVTVALALLLRNYWALVLGMLFGKLLELLLSYRAHPYRPRFTLAARNDLFGFSKWLLLSNFLGYLQSNADKLIMGRTIGARSLGVYNMAFELAILPSTALIAPINRAVYPAYARLHTDLPALQAKFLEVFGNIVLMALPVSTLLVMLARPVVLLLLGPGWLDAVPLLQILVSCGIVGALQSNLYSLLMALGKPKVSTLIQGITVVFSLPTMVWASLTYGALGAAWAAFAAALFGLLPLQIVFFRTFHLPVALYWGTWWRPLLATAAMALAMAAVAGTAVNSITGIVEIVKGGAAGLAAYGLTLLLLWRLGGRPQNTAEANAGRWLVGRIQARRGA